MSHWLDPKVIFAPKINISLNLAIFGMTLPLFQLLATQTEPMLFFEKFQIRYFCSFSNSVHLMLEVSQSISFAMHYSNGGYLEGKELQKSKRLMILSM